MNKLIVLLNEFLDDWQERLYACDSLEEWVNKFFHTKDGEWIIEEAQVISGKFWFIEWLVKNKEIDRKKDNSLKFKIIIEKNEDSYYEITPDNYSSLLMKLAINDDPIEFLSSILK